MANDQEVTALRQFCKVVDDLYDCRFIQRAKVQDHTITIDRDPSKNRLPNYDPDEFRSFATLFRKLVADREPTQLFRVMKILKRYAPDDQKHTFRNIKAELNHLAEHPPIGIAIGTDGAEVPYSPKRICDVLFNGLIFHTDRELQDDVARILGYQPIVMAAFLQYSCAVVNVATQYACVIEYHNFFRDGQQNATLELRQKQSSME